MILCERHKESIKIKFKKKDEQTVQENGIWEGQKLPMHLLEYNVIWSLSYWHSSASCETYFGNI